jgi:hypothetical protein
MAYPEGEALIFTKLRSVTGFTGATSTTENTSRGKWGLLNSGNSDHYAIIKPGEFERTQGAMSMNISRFTTVIQVWMRYTDDGVTLTTLEGYVKAIIAYFDQWRKVADTTGTIVDAFIASGGEVTEQWNKDGGLSWLKQDLKLIWQEHDTVSYGE